VKVILTVGSQAYPFDRLVRAMDDWAGRHPEHEVTMQIGCSHYLPRHAARHFELMDLEHFQRLFAESDVAVSHASTGPLLMARRAHIPIVVVPRQKPFRESFDEHQMHFSQSLEGTSAVRTFVYDIHQLPAALEWAFECRGRADRYEPPLLKQRLIHAIAASVESASHAQDP